MPRKPKTTVQAPQPAAEAAVPKRRGRKPGSKNKTTSKRGRKPARKSVNVFEAIEKELKAMAVALLKAKKAAEKQLAKAEAAAEKAIAKVEAKAEKKVERLKTKLKAKRRRPGRPAKRGRKPVPKPPGRRGRPPKNSRKRGGRPRKGEPTKKSIILDYMKELNKPIKSGDLITALFERSGEVDKKRFAQGMYTTLTQIYKSGELKNNNGVISLA